MTTVKKLIEYLNTHYADPDTVLAVAIWCRDDVLDYAKDLEIELSDSEADDIVESIDCKQDATLGISWDTIECYVDDFDAKKGDKTK